MSMETVVAVYDSDEHAREAVRALVGAGVPPNAISQHAPSEMTNNAITTPAPARETGFWASLFGGEPDTDHDAHVYDRSLAGGSTVVSVQVPGQSVHQVVEILERYSPVDIDERASTYNVTKTTTTTTATPVAAKTKTPAPTAKAEVRKAEGDTIQLAEESLSVGKRVVNRGTTRIRRYVVETPVEEQVTLHSEKVIVERHPVAGSLTATAADFSEKTLEMTETDEQAIVGKSSRIYEEVGLRKEASDRTETVRDTVRREEVEITQEPVVKTTTATVKDAKLNPLKPKV